MASNNLEDLHLVVDKLGIDRIKRHIFLCVGEKCCSQELGMKTWDFLKERCRQADAAEVGVYRTKVSCLRICQKGPIALVYPEGVWYGNVTIDACKRIFDEHVIGGKIVSAGGLSRVKWQERPAARLTMSIALCDSSLKHHASSGS